MSEIEKMRDYEIVRLYMRLQKLEPDSEEYSKIRSQLCALLNSRNEEIKTENENKNSKTDTLLKIGMFGATLLIAPFIELIVKRNLTKYIGTIEQMETFTSTPGRSISSWFKFKN